MKLRIAKKIFKRRKSPLKWRDSTWWCVAKRLNVTHEAMKHRHKELEIAAEGMRQCMVDLDVIMKQFCPGWKSEEDSAKVILDDARELP